MGKEYWFKLGVKHLFDFLFLCSAESPGNAEVDPFYNIF